MVVVLVELAAFVVVVFVIWRYVKPLIQQMIRDRQEHIQAQVDASEEAIERLREAERRFEQAEAEARKEVAKIRDDARADATRIAEELQEQADREVERIRQRGQEQLAERVVVEMLSDERRRSATVDQFLSDLEDLAPRDETSTATATGGTR
jgi:F-type H+-transporting ATPase subunit b